MPTLTAGELTLLGTHPHSFKEYLAVLQPATVLACQLNGAPSGDPVTSITYDNVTAGAFGDVVVGMTLLIGSSAGARDKGTCRIRAAPTADTLYIAEDSAVDWVDDDYLTVVESYELWVKYPRIVANGSLVFYKDWEDTYSDQHENWPPVAIMGPPDCQIIDAATGLATCEFVGEHSYAVAPGASISSYAWTFPDGTPADANTAGTDASPHDVTWDTAGTYWVTLTVTDSNGKTHTGRRPVFIFDSGANAPYTRFKMTGRGADLNQHGHTARFEIHGDADQAQFPDRALVVYFTEDWYGSTKQSIGGNYTGRAHIKFVGCIHKESTSKDPQTSVVTFDAATINALMDSREGFSAWIKNKGDATTWCEATYLTADRAALSLCRHNSTLLDICDVVVSGDTEYIKSQEFAAKTSLLQQLQTLYNDLFAHVACDKQGRLYFEIDPQMLAEADRASIDIIVDLAHGDWRDRLDLPRPQEAKTSFINLAGVHYAGHPHEVTPILSKAPGDAPAYMGRTIEIAGLILGGQSDGNTKAGLALARENNQFPDVTLPMPGLWDVFDIVPQEYVRLSLAAADTKRGIVWTNQKLIPRRVELTVEQTDAGRVPRVTIHVEKDSLGPAGVDGDYPEEPPEPPVNPPLPPPPTPPPGGYEGEAGPAVASHSEDGCYWTDSRGESWEARNTALPATAILDLIWDPWWWTAQRSGGRDPDDVILLACGVGFIAKKVGSADWGDFTPSNDPPNAWGDPAPPTSATVTFKQLHADIHNIDTFYALVEWQEVGGAWRWWIAKTTDNCANWTWYDMTGTGPSGFEVLLTASSSPHNVLVIGDSETFTQEDEEYGYRITSTSRYFYFTPRADHTHLTIELEFYNCPQGWTPGDIEDFGLLQCTGTGGWLTFGPVTKARAGTAGTPDQLKCIPRGGNEPWIRKVSLKANTLQYGEPRPLAMDLDTEAGSRLYVTVWEDGEIYLENRNATTLVLNVKTDIAAATEAQVADKTRFIVPRCPHVLGGTGFGDHVWLFGRWDDGGPKHLAYSDDGGATLVDKGEATWDANHRLGALDVLYDGDTVYAFVNHASTPRLWRSLDQAATWDNINSMPFNVEFESQYRCNWADDEFIIARNAAAAMMAAWVESPYTGSWTDATGSPSLPTASGAITAIIWVG